MVRVNNANELLRKPHIHVNQVYRAGLNGYQVNERNSRLKKATAVATMQFG